jgi:hypothetical protein
MHRETEPPSESSDVIRRDYLAMTDHSLYYPYASFTDARLPLLKVAALDFDKLTVLDPLGTS